MEKGWNSKAIRKGKKESLEKCDTFKKVLENGPKKVSISFDSNFRTKLIIETFLSEISNIVPSRGEGEKFFEFFVSLLFLME